MANLGEAVLVLKTDGAQLNQGLDEAKSKAEGTSSGMSTAAKVGIAAMAGIGIAAGKTAVDAIGAFVGFEKQMNEVFTLIPGASSQAMNAMTGDVKSFAKEFGTLPTEVVPALYQAISAGVPSDNVFSFLEVAQKAAVGGVTDLTTAVDGITSTVNAYGAETIDATQASDLMFTAVKLGKTNFEELSRSLFQVNPVASALGVEFGDVTAALASMTAQGVPTSVATTQLRQAFVELSKDGGKTSEVFQELAGSSFKDFIASGGNVQDALQLLEQHAKDSGIGINDLFGSVEAGAAALALTGGGTEAFSAALEEMANSAGATDTAFNTMEGGLGRSIDKIKAHFAVMKIELGEKLAPAVRVVTDFVIDKMLPGMASLGAVIGEKVSPVLSVLGGYARDAADAFMGFIQSEAVVGIFERVWDALTRVGEVIGNVVMPLLEPFKTLIGNIKDNWQDFATVISPMLSIVVQLAGAFGEGGLRGAMDALPGIIGNVGESFKNVAGIIGDFLLDLGSVILDQITSIDWGGVASSVIDGLSSALSAAASGVVSMAGVIAEWFTGVDWGGTASTIISGLVGALSTAANAAADLGSTVIAWFTSVDWGGAAGTIIDGLVTALSAAAGVAADFGSTVAGWFTSIEWGEIASTIVSGLVTAITAVADVATTIGTWIGDLFGQVEWGEVANNMVENLMTAVTAVQDVGTRIVDWMSASLASADFSSMGETISGGISTSLEAIEGIDALAPIAGFLTDTLWPALTMIADIITDRLGPTFIDLGTSFAEVGGIISSELGPTLTNLQGLWDAMAPVLTIVATIIGGVLVGALGALVGFLAGALPGAVSAVIAVFNGLIQIVTGVVTVITGVVNIVVGLLTGDWAQAWDGAKQVVSGTITAIVGLLSGLWGLVSGVLTGFVKGVIGFFKGLYTALVGGSIVPDMIRDIVTWFTKLPGEVLGIITGFVGEAISAFTGLAGDAISAISGMIGDIIGAISGFVGDFIGEISGLVSDVVGEFTGLAGDALGAITGMIGDIIGAISGFVGDFVGDITSMVSDTVTEFGRMVTESVSKAGEMVTEVVAKAGELITEMVRIAGEVISGFISGLGEGISQAAGVMGEIISAITGAFGDAASLLTGIAGDIIGGLVSGLRAGKDAVGGAAGDIGGWIIDKKGPIEYDRVMLRPHAAAIIGGLVDGLRAGRPEVERSARDITSSILTGITETGDERLSQITEKFRGYFQSITGVGKDAANAFGSYIWAIIQDGDHLNDWLTQLPEDVRGTAKDIGRVLSEELHQTGSFESLGQRHSSAYARGIEDGRGEVTTAATQLSEATYDAVVEELGGGRQFHSQTFLNELSVFSEFILSAVVDSASNFEVDLINAAKGYTEAVVSAVGMLSQAFELMSLLGKSNPDVERAMTAVTELKFFTEHIVESIGDTAWMLDYSKPENFLPMAEIYMQSAEQGLDLMMSGVEAFTTLSDLEGDLDRAKDAASNIKFLTEHIVLSIGDSAAYVSSTRGEGFTTAAEEYITAAEKGIALMHKGVAIMGELSNMEGDLDTAMLSASEIKFLTEHIVLSIGDSAAYISSIRGEGFIAHAATYAEAAVIAVGLMDEGIKAFEALQTFEGDLTIAKNAATQIKELIEHIVQSIGDSAELFRKEYLEHISVFSTAAFDSQKLMVEALDTLGAMLAYGTMDTSGVNLQARANDMVALIETVTRSMQTVALTFETVGLSAVENFSTAAQAGMATIGQAGDALQAILLFATVDTSNRDLSKMSNDMVALIELITRNLEIVAVTWDRKGLEAVETFSNSASRGLDLMKVAGEAIASVLMYGEMTPEARDNLKHLAWEFTGVMDYIISMVYEVSTRYNREAITALARFSEDAGKSLQMIKSAADAFKAMVDHSRVTNEHADAFLSSWEIAIYVIEQIAHMVSTQGVQEALRVLNAVEEIAALMNAAASVYSGIQPIPAASSSPAPAPPPASTGVTGSTNVPSTGAATGGGTAAPSGTTVRKLEYPEGTYFITEKDGKMLHWEYVPNMASGGVTTSPTTVRVSERGQKEAIIPLDGKGSALVAEAIVKEIANSPALGHKFAQNYFAGFTLPRGAAESGNVAVNFLGSTTINARDRDEARRAGEDIGWGIQQKLRAGGRV